MAKSRKRRGGVRESGAGYKAPPPRQTAVYTSTRRRRAGAAEPPALRAQIQAGLEALDQGRFTDVADSELDRHIEGLATPKGPRPR